MTTGNGRGFRGRGRGRGGGGGGGRGNGGGGGGGANRGGRGGGRGTPGWSMPEDDLEFNLRMFADAPSGSGNNTPNGKGRGGRGGRNTGPNSGTATPNRGRGRGRGVDSPRGRGYDSPRGSGRGRGAPSDKYFTGKRGEMGIGVSPRGRGGGPQKRPDTLSGLLYQERPFLRPIKFVPSVLTKVLFQQEEDEELLKPIVEDVDETEQSHVPTADQVFRVFSGRDIPRMESDSNDEDEAQEEIEEVDFNEVDQLFNPSAEVKTTTIRKSKLSETITTVEETFTGFYIDPNPTNTGLEENSNNDRPSESIEVDVNDLAKMVEETLSTTDEQPNAEDVEMSAPYTAEESMNTIEDIAVARTQNETTTIEAQQDFFCIDVQPSSVPQEMAPSGDHVPSALRDDEDDDIIVYVAPHPRKMDSQNEETTSSPPLQDQSAERTLGESISVDTSHFEPYVRPATLPLSSVASSSTAPMPSEQEAPPSFSSVSFSFSQKTSTATPTGKETMSTRLVVPPVSTPRQAKAWKRKRGVTKKGRMKSSSSSFGAFGAMREEAMLHKTDPRRHERRRGDSDLEWGDSDDDDYREVDEVEEGLEGLLGWKLSENEKGKGKAKEEEMTPEKDKGKGKARVDNDDHGMEVDPDLAPDMAAMKSFVGGLLGENAGQHTSIDDLNVAEMIRMEDEEDENNTGDDEESSEDEAVEDAIAGEEAMMISETLEFDDDGLDDEEDSDDDEDEDQTPRTSFQARLERIRNKAESQKREDTTFGHMDGDEDEDEDEDDMLKRNMTWADEDEDFIQKIQEMMDDQEDVVRGKDRKARNAVFRSIRDGDFEDMEGFSPAKKRKDKGKDLPPELRALWEKDRQKKAEYKKARELARLENAADPMTPNKGGKKGRKAMRAAAKLDPTITVIPNRIIDMVTLVQQIRRFIAEIGGPASMSLPPTNKETRKNIHEMAIAFNLKSVSKGKGDSRYTTLTKTSRTGLGVDEYKVARVVRKSGGMGARGDSFVYDKKGKAPTNMPRHREGDEVGKAAPKLTETNVGFRMLSMMGWSEGDRIGFAGGLDAPLTAIIKNTKLGLGATR